MSTNRFRSWSAVAVVGLLLGLAIGTTTCQRLTDHRRRLDAPDFWDALVAQTGGEIARHGPPTWLVLVEFPGGCRGYVSFDGRPGPLDPNQRLRVGGLIDTAEGGQRPKAEADAAQAVLDEVVADVASGADGWTPERARARWREVLAER